MGEGFTGVPVGAETTLFVRPTGDGVEGYVVDNVQLVETLKQRVLAERGLSEWVDVSATQGTNGETEVFRHQFAAPFSEVSAALRLAPLEVPWSERLLVPLFLVITLLLLLGLWALYRVVRTQLEFAARQNNFVSAVSHELKTPLTSILMHGEMLEEGLAQTPEQAQQYYQTITSQAQRLTRLINNVLSISKVEQKRGSQTNVNLNDVIHRVALHLKPQLESDGFTLVFDLPDGEMQAVGDADSLEQILVNLVENAIKYAKGAEDRRITIALEASASSLLLSVRDRGPGIAEQHLQRIFEPFYRCEDEMTRKHSGTGLGLALVASLAEQMSGSVRALATPPGVTFQVTVQRVRTTQNEKASHD